jgi:putative oxidoreductase
MSTTVTMRKVRTGSVALWVVQVLLAVAFVPTALMKLSGDPVMVTLFADIGAGQWFRYVVGTLELAGAIGLLIPRLCGLAALGLAGVMTGAVVTNIFVLGYSPVVALGYLLVAATIAWFRRSAIRDLVRRFA